MSESLADAILISVNAEPATVRVGSLGDVLVQLGYGDVRIATALNGEFVPERMRAATPVAAGDRIEIVSARQGG